MDWLWRTKEAYGGRRRVLLPLGMSPLCLCAGMVIQGSRRNGTWEAIKMNQCIGKLLQWREWCRALYVLYVQLLLSPCMHAFGLPGLHVPSLWS